MLYCAVNGKENSHISVTERGFSYGDGTFTTAKILNGKVLHLQKHIQRLTTACNTLKIPFEAASELEQQLISVVKKYPLAVLKVIITAGEGGRGYSRIGASQSNVVVSVFDFPSHYLQWQNKGISLGHSSIQLGINPLLAGVKHLNRLEQVLIRKELDDLSFDDVVVTDLNNNIVEASSANIFWMINDEIFTSEIVNAGVSGLIREQLLTYSEQAKLPPIQVVKSNLSTLASATSIFLTNSVMEIVPVSCYQRKALNIKPVLTLQSKLLELSQKDY